MTRRDVFLVVLVVTFCALMAIGALALGLWSLTELPF